MKSHEFPFDHNMHSFVERFELHITLPYFVQHFEMVEELKVSEGLTRFSWISVQDDLARHYLHSHGPLARNVKLRVAHAPGMTGTLSPPPRVSDPDMHHGTCVTHVPWCMPASLTSGFAWSRWRGKRSRHSRRMRNPQLYVFGKRPIPI